MAQKTITANVDGKTLTITADVPDDATQDEIVSAVRAHLANNPVQTTRATKPGPGSQRESTEPKSQLPTGPLATASVVAPAVAMGGAIPGAAGMGLRALLGGTAGGGMAAAGGASPGDALLAGAGEGAGILAGEGGGKVLGSLFKTVQARKALTASIKALEDQNLPVSNGPKIAELKKQLGEMPDTTELAKKAAKVAGLTGGGWAGITALRELFK